MWCATPATAQSIDQFIDEQQYLEGLSELYLPEVLEHYITTHPTNDPVRQTQYQIALQRMAMRRPNTTPSRRTQHLEAIIELRQALIDTQPDDPRRAQWLIDQAAMWMFEMFNVEAAGWTSQFGSATPRQRETAREAAAAAHALAGEARDALGEALLSIESKPGFASDVEAQLQRQRLIDRERRRRLPLVSGIAAVAHAELSDDHETAQQLYEHAASSLQSAIDVVDGAAACHGRVYLALALTRLGRFAEAEEIANAALEPGRCNNDLRALAAMTQVEITGARDGPQAAIERIDSAQRTLSDSVSLLQRVLLTDQLFRWRRARAMELEGEARTTQLASATQAYLDLLEMDHEEPADVIRSIVVSRIANVADESMPLEHLPALVTVSLAEARAREPATREAAISLLRDLLERGDVEGSDRAAALFTLGRALYEDRRTLEAARRFLQLAREHPADSQAERAIELAATLARDLFERQRSTPDVRQLLDESVSLLLERYPNLRRADRWRYVAGELAVFEQRFDDAAAHFERINSQSEQYLDALFMCGNAAKLAAEAESDRLRRITLNEQAVDEIRQVRQPIENALSSDELSSARRTALQYYLTYLSVFEAQALLELTDAQRALDVLDVVQLDDDLDAEARADVLLTRIKAYQMLGRSGEAQQEVSSFLDTAPDQISHVLPPLMMEIEREVRELQEFGLDEEAQARAHRELLPLANLLSRWLEANLSAGIDDYQLRRRIAAAFALSGEYEYALAEYERLLARQPNLLSLLLGKAECLYHLGGRQRLAEAIELYKRIGAVERDHGSPTYWQSQVRMLQILDMVGQNTDQIAPRIEQLEQRDPALGGPPWQEQFNALRRKYR